MFLPYGDFHYLLVRFLFTLLAVFAEFCCFIPKIILQCK